MTRHRFHGDETRFDVLAEFITTRFPQARYVADVAGGQGMLTRLLRKRFGLEAEVVDPRGWTLKGVPARAEPYLAALADYYDLIVGLHPDEALREVVDSARVRPVLVVPCCNFWDRDRKLGRDELLAAITAHHRALGGRCEHVELAFRGPKNHALVLLPPV
ncbi:hypothetical protein Cs7R123_45580 [Catellatospora sp. TT07R-123]|uniref:hypothetical protein n=1 Tax=Catellatospora sp. TT07R-123 TaxID=2733863 RepID=UPI001B1CAA3B|nr:hypothetical protein [Catellatospora sp. TT07R-123]GHJ47216.1 hypothetical protein Cs7R123_45580 [Catellatospora sp. TT07R-123]